jgi:hypothetical protein
MDEFDKIYEIVKNNKIGFRQEFIIDSDRYLVFIREDKKVNGTEVVFRKLLKESK